MFINNISVVIIEALVVGATVGVPLLDSKVYRAGSSYILNSLTGST